MPRDFKKRPTVNGENVALASEVGGSETLASTIMDAKGDIISASAADTPVRKAVGANDTVLKADSTQTDGLIWEQVAFSELTGTASEAQTATAIQKSLVDAKGDIIAATAADTVARLAVGANGTVLTAASGQTTGLQWVAPSAGAQVAEGSYTGNAGTDRTIALAFTPKFAVIQHEGGTNYFFSNLNTGTRGMRVTGTSVNTSTANSNRPLLTTNGFIVTDGANGPNVSGETYHYFVIG